MEEPVLLPVEDIPRAAVVVAVFREPVDAEVALKAISRSAFPPGQLSIAGRDHQGNDHVVAYADDGVRRRFWGRRGVFWGSVAGLTVGSALLVVPGIGTVFAFGPLSRWIMTALEGGAVVGGTSAAGAGFVSLGVPEPAIARLEGSLRSGDLVLAACGGHEEVRQAREILHRTRARECTEYQRVPAPA